MPIENWSDHIGVVHLADEPQFTDDLAGVDEAHLAEGAAVILDLGAVTFVSSSNLAQMLDLRKLLEKKKGRLVLAGASAQVRNAFAVTGLTSLFTFAESVPLALAMVQIDS